MEHLPLAIESSSGASFSAALEKKWETSCAAPETKCATSWAAPSTCKMTVSTFKRNWETAVESDTREEGRRGWEKEGGSWGRRSKEGANQSVEYSFYVVKLGTSHIQNNFLNLLVNGLLTFSATTCAASSTLMGKKDKRLNFAIFNENSSLHFFFQICRLKTVLNLYWIIISLLQIIFTCISNDSLRLFLSIIKICENYQIIFKLINLVFELDF